MKLPRQPAAVIFDMDGLLFDTERFYAEAIMTAAREVGCAMSHDVFLQLVGRAREVNHRFLLEHYGADYPLDALIATWGRHFQALTSSGLPLKPGAVELLDLLDELGLPRALATSARTLPFSATWSCSAWPTVSMLWWGMATMPMASLHLIRFSRRPNGWVWRRRSAWRWRILTVACDRHQLPA